MADKVVSTVLKYTVDDASVRKAVAANQQVAASSKAAADITSRSFLDSFSQGKVSTEVLSTALGRQVETTKDLADAYEALNSKINLASSSAKTAASTGFSQNLTDVLPTSGEIRSSGLGRAGNIARFASQAFPGSGASQLSGGLELAGAAQDILGISVSLGAVAAIAAPVAVAIGAYSVLLDAQRTAEEKLAAATQATIDKIQLEADVREKVAGVISTGSTATAQAKITEAETQRDALLTGQYKDTVDAMQKYVDEVLTPQAASEARGDLRAAGINPGDDIYTSELKRRTAENVATLTAGDATLTKYSDTLKGFNKQLDVFGTTITDLTTIGLPGAKVLEAINRPLEDRQKLDQLEAKSSSDLLKQRTADITELVGVNQRVTDTEAAIKKARADGNNTLADTLTNQNVKNRADVAEIERELNLIAISQQLVMARERETEAAKKFRDMLNGLTKGASGVVGDVFKVSDTLNKAQDAFNTAAQSHADKRLSIIADEADKEAGILSDASADAAKLAEKYGVDQKRAQEDLQRELKQLRAQSANDQLTDIQDRNSVALDRDRRQEKLTENKDKENAAVTARRKQQDYDRELRQLATATQKRLDEQRAGEVKALALEDQRWRIQQQGLQQQVDVTQTAFTALSGSANKFGLAVDAAVNSVNSSLGRLNTGSIFGNAVGNVFGNIPSHALGLASVPYDGYVARLHKGERILTAQQNSSRNFVFAPTFNGHDWPAVEKQMVRAFRSYTRGLRN